MKNNKSLSTIIAALLFTFLSHQALSQANNDLTIFESSKEMVATAKEIITEIPVSEFKKIFDNETPTIIDVRTAGEHENGAIPGAINIPRGLLEFRIDSEELWSAEGKSVPEKSDTFFVYCGTGSRGALSAKALMQLGYKNVQSIKGGWNAWHEAYPELSN